MSGEQLSIYELVGGDPTFLQLVEVFYEAIEADEVLRPLFPEDLEPGKRNEFLFLVQFFGGPAIYAQERGHPRLRMRHAPFKIDQEARDRWVKHMFDALDKVGIQEPMLSTMRGYFERAATHMINVESYDVRKL